MICRCRSIPGDLLVELVYDISGSEKFPTSGDASNGSGRCHGDSFVCFGFRRGGGSGELRVSPSVRISSTSVDETVLDADTTFNGDPQAEW